MKSSGWGTVVAAQCFSQLQTGTLVWSGDTKKHAALIIDETGGGPKRSKMMR